MRPYSRSTAPAASTSQSASNAFELRLPPLPHDDDDDLIDPATIARARGLKPAKKVAGVRHKVKDPRGKKRRRESDSEDDSDAPTGRRGRPSGSGNYSKEDTKCLLDNLQEELPLGPKGWKVVAARFKQWVDKHGRPEQGQKSLETKFKQVCHLLSLQLFFSSHYCSSFSKPRSPPGPARVLPRSSVLTRSRS